MGQVKGYEMLDDVLARAFDQAASGKGAERHANSKPFHEQPMQKIADRRGIGFILGQADKKSEEAQGMLERGERDAAVRELLGAIVYLAGAVIFIQRDGDEAMAEPANDNRLVTLYDKQPTLPDGFLPWDPTWIEKGIAQPPASEVIHKVAFRYGHTSTGADWNWGPNPADTDLEIVGYKLHG